MIWEPKIIHRVTGATLTLSTFVQKFKGDNKMILLNKVTVSGVLYIECYNDCLL